jgi:hypothetical protein
MRFARAVSFVAVLLTAAFLSGQTGTSTIRGTVTDPQGRVISAAKVTLTNVATNATRTTTSTESGAYAFELITPGNYRIEVESHGFKKKAVDEIHAAIGKPTETNIQLEVGTVGEVVEVRSTGQEVLVNTQDATLGNVFVSQQITQLPLEARSVVDLLSLQPGSTREGYVAGARADQSNVTLDGVDINNAQSGNAEIPRASNSLVLGALDNDRGNITTGPVLRLNSEAVEEFRVTTANGNANQGRSSGSQINLATKSGSNTLHGAGFEFYRSRGFTANDWFNNHATDANGNWSPVPRPPLQRNTYGGAIGGPIVKNKVFFFYSYEGRRDASSTPQTEVVPLASLGQGILNYTYCTDPSCSTTAVGSLSNAQSQAAYAATLGLNPAALAALADAAAKFPANDTSQGDGLNTGGFRFNAPTPVKLNSHVAKFDFNLTSNQTAFVRLSVIHDHQTLPQYLPGVTPRLIWNHPRGIAVGHTWTIGNHWVNNFRYGLTRQAFTQGGDSNGNDISFRFVFQPNFQVHTLTRVTPVHNFTDDVSWIHGNHSIQFGANIRKINNSRVSFANAFDNAITNPSFFLGGGEGVSDQFQAYLTANGLPGNENAGQSLASISEIQNAATAVIGRLSQYTADFTFAKDGSLLPAGAPAVRNFATQAYDTYIQDTWKARHNLTLTLGLRYSLERPVYETQGFEVQPTVPLSTFFQERLAAARNGQNFVDPIVINRSGPANGGKPMYNWDKNNFQPRVAFAWSLDSQSKSVLRGGFALTNDYYGQALAVDWDLSNTLGFTSNFTTPANTFDTTPGSANGLAPLFTGFNQDVRSLPLVSVPGKLQFPLSQPIDYGERIESSVDSALHAPTEYVWNLTFERQLPANTVLSASYIGRAARSLLAHRDVTAFNNIRDPKSGMDWYTAGTMLEKQRAAGVDTSQIAPIPFFENLLPPNAVQIFNDPNFLDAGFDPTWSNTQAFYAFNSRTPSNPVAFFGGNDWTDTQAIVDQALANAGAPTLFMQPQYGALSAWSTIGNSNYNAFTFSLRTRLNSLMLDFNYTWSHSTDDASGLQSEAGFGNNNGNGSFIVNPIRQRDNYASSDFDTRHNVNIDGVWQMPFGKGRALFGNANSFADAIVGGWQLSGIFRFNTGLPVTSPFDDARWATNWNVQANVTPTRQFSPCPNRPAVGDPKLFGGSGCDVTKIYQSFRNAYPGETGPRNYLRYPGFIDVDFGLGKTWKMPWKEGHQLQARWDVFNVTNTQHFGLIDISRTGFGVGRDPARRALTPPSNWSNFTSIQGQPRVMQVGLRYSF